MFHWYLTRSLREIPYLRALISPYISRLLLTRSSSAPVLTRFLDLTRIESIDSEFILFRHNVVEARNSKNIAEYNAPTKSKLQHPHPAPPWAKPGHLNFWRFDRSNSSPLGPKWCSNALAYRQVCLSNAPPKEQFSSVPVVCNKACTFAVRGDTNSRWKGILDAGYAVHCTL